MQQAVFYLNKFRFLLAGIFALAFVLLISALVTSLGNNSVLASRSNLASSTNNNLSASSDYISNEAASLATDFRQDMIATGRAIYKTCSSINKTSSNTSGAVIHDTASTVAGIGHGAVFINQAINNVAMDALHAWSHGAIFTFRIPIKIVSSISSVRSVSDLVQPSDSNPVPVIQTKLSAVQMASVEAEIKQNTENLQKQKQQQASQAAANSGLNGVIVAGDPRHGGYPTAWNNAPMDSMADPWGMLNRECVSYTAWKVYQTYGSMPFWGGVGNANEWPADARAAGIATGSVPKVHSVAIWAVGYYGHAMWVEKVQGNMIHVSQYNYDMQGDYSEMWVNGSDFTYIYFK